MNLDQHLHTWVLGESVQGWIMLAIGVLLSIGIVLMARSDSDLLRGMFIPIAVLTAMNLGYGGVLIGRTTTYQKAQEAIHLDRSQKAERELSKAKNDTKYYARSRLAWAFLTAAAVLLILIFRTDYLRGLSLGLTAMFLGALVIDTFLYARLLTYIANLEQLTSHLTG